MTTAQLDAALELYAEASAYNRADFIGGGDEQFILHHVEACIADADWNDRFGWRMP